MTIYWQHPGLPEVTGSQPGTLLKWHFLHLHTSQPAISYDTMMNNTNQVTRFKQTVVMGCALLLHPSLHMTTECTAPPQGVTAFCPISITVTQAEQQCMARDPAPSTAKSQPHHFTCWSL